MVENGPKRLVVRHADGLHQIMGIAAPGMPAEFVDAAHSGIDEPVCLVASKPRYWLYKTLMSAPWKCFCGVINVGKAPLCGGCGRPRGDR